MNATQMDQDIAKALDTEYDTRDAVLSAATEYMDYTGGMKLIGVGDSGHARLEALDGDGMAPDLELAEDGGAQWKAMDWGSVSCGEPDEWHVMQASMSWREMPTVRAWLNGSVDTIDIENLQTADYMVDDSGDRDAIYLDESHNIMAAWKGAREQ